MDKALCIFVLLASSLISLVSSQIEGYCNIPSCEDRVHTLCEYPVNEPSEKCGKIIQRGLTDSEIQEILDLHNSLRNRVASGAEERGNPGPQPPATDMDPITWDDELYAIAQTWVDQCTIDHDPCRDVGQYQVGQNLAYGESSGNAKVTLSYLVSGWYDEVDVFDKSLVNSFVFAEAYGHYSQLVWAKSTKIGCGLIRYTQDDKTISTLLVCDYGPSGNFPNEPVYTAA